MAKHRRRRRFRKYLKGNIDKRVSLGTLAGNTAVLSLVSDSVDEKAYLSSVKATYSLGEVTPLAGNGPCQIFIAHSDYSLAEVEEYIENVQSWSEGDMISQEIAKRKIRFVGAFETSDNPLDVTTMNDGKQITTKCGWMLTSGDTVAFAFYNSGGVAYATTDPEVTINGHANLWPA